MDEKTALEISIKQADSLKRMTRMSGWKIIEDFLSNEEEECQEKLDNEENKDIIDIQSARALKRFIREFRELFIDTEISANNDKQELKIIRKE